MEREIKKRSYYFPLEVVRFVNSLNGKGIKFCLSDQLLRSATSVGANLVEATSAHSRKDFIKFYEIALKSANESKYWFCLFRDGLDVDKERVKKLLQEAVEISKVVASIIIKLKKTKQPFRQVKEQLEEYFPF